MQSKKFILVILAVLAGFAAGIYVIKPLYRKVPSDYKRTQYLIEDLQKEHLDMVLLGNSILMSGIDAKRLSDEIPGRPLIHNLSSPGQTLKESMLFYPMLDSTTKKVFLFIRMDNLLSEPQVLEHSVLRNFFMFGYKPSPDLKQLLSAEELSYFENSPLKIYYESRFVVPNYINSNIRLMLREDLDAEKSKDLFFPNVYSKRFDSLNYVNAIRKFDFNTQKEIVLNTGTLDLLQKGNVYLKNKGIQLYVVIHPINPDLKNYTMQVREDIKQQWAMHKKGLQVIDLSGCLQSKDFVDHWHITRTGAAVLTDSLAQKINTHVIQLY